MTKKDEKANPFLKIISGGILKAVIGVIVLSGLLVALVLFGLSVYTRHGDAILVPSVKGLQIEEAAGILNKSSLTYEVVDSVFLTGGTLGAIIDQVPDEESSVKEGRIIFLTMQAKSVEMVTIPMMRDYSRRQAIASLNSIGFTNITVSEVPSAYRGLVLSLSYQGKEVEPNSKLPKGAPLHMTVGAGGEVIIDSLIDIIPDPGQLDFVEPTPDVDNSFFE